MKHTALTKLLVSAFISLTLSGLAQAQVYQFTAPISGFQEVGAADPGNVYVTPGVLGWTGSQLNFGTLTETIYYDSAANTVRQVGSFLIPTTMNLSFDDSKYVSGTLVPASVSVAYTFNDGNDTVSFDTGVQPLSANPATQAANTSGYSLNWQIPFTASVTLTTGGQDYYGSFAGSIRTDWAITYVSQLTTDSLVIQQGYDHIFGGSAPFGSYTSFTATNGLTAMVADRWNDGTLYQYYYVAPVTVTAAPEPRSLMIFALGAFGLTSILRRRAH